MDHIIWASKIENYSGNGLGNYGYLWKFISPCFIIFIMVYYVGAWTGMVVPRTRPSTFLHGRLVSVTALKRNIIWFLSIFNLGWISWICDGIFKERLSKMSAWKFTSVKKVKILNRKKYDMDSWLFYCKTDENSGLFNIWGNFMPSLFSLS